MSCKAIPNGYSSADDKTTGLLRIFTAMPECSAVSDMLRNALSEADVQRANSLLLKEIGGLAAGIGAFFSWRDTSGALHKSHFSGC